MAVISFDLVMCENNWKNGSLIQTSSIGVLPIHYTLREKKILISQKHDSFPRNTVLNSNRIKHSIPSNIGFILQYSIPGSWVWCLFTFTILFSHLADTFIQSDLQIRKSNYNYKLKLYKYYIYTKCDFSMSPHNHSLSFTISEAHSDEGIMKLVLELLNSIPLIVLITFKYKNVVLYTHK